MIADADGDVVSGVLAADVLPPLPGWVMAADEAPRVGARPRLGPDHIHRMGGSVDGSVSIHASSPPLWRRGQSAVGADGEMRGVSVSYAEELRPLDA